jgi:glycosyltransferase involved in cell wall biosynthesis
MGIDLSILHTTYNRAHFLSAVLHRFELNAQRHPEVDFELIVLDGGSSDSTQEICREFLDRETFKLKYVHVGFGRWVNPSLPRNIALRHAVGRIGCTTDADHWVGQDFVKGAYGAFRNDVEDAVSIGMVWDTNEARKLPWPKVNEALINTCQDDLNILRLYDAFGVPTREPKSGWIVAYPMSTVFQIGGYDENFEGNHWGRDEDIFLLKLQYFLKTTKEHHLDFAALHLCHDTKQFGIQRNPNYNHEIFVKKRDNIEQAIEEAADREWGRIPAGVESYVWSNY